MSLQTLNDIKRSLDPDGNHAVAIDLLMKDAAIHDDVVWVEGNELTGHTTTQIITPPVIYDTALNEGTPNSKAGKRQITEAFGIMEGNSSVDVKVANIMPSVEAWRNDEDGTFIEALNTGFRTRLFYGDRSLVPKQFTGLHPRFNTPSTTNTDSGYHLIDGAGTGADNSSIWLLGWSPQTLHMSYPKHSKAGLQVLNKGENKSADSNGNTLWTLDTNFLWNLGLVVRDYRAVSRICNIDVSDLTKNAATGADIIDLMSIAAMQVKPAGVRRAFYVNEKIMAFLNRQARNLLTGSTLSYTDLFERREVLTFQGIPVRLVEELTEAEATIAGTFAWS